ncbi:MAG: alanine--tRNA ligase [Dehalococcoidia bacterium]|nr:alanine--tRNA ligase [Dehalococcoidia bacterium]
MKSPTVHELRTTFLQFFEERGHRRIPSSSLVPHGDPTLLFTTAGMVQFKPYFMGLEAPPARRMTSVQKCFRTTDIESVGDESHLTFFEMLGNFSIGEYFKPEAVEWAWAFLTGLLEIPPERLWATVYIDDEETFALWRARGLPPERILRYTAEQGNFWGPPGDSGPCGPCSELHYDFGPRPGCDPCARGACHPDVGCGRFLEIWNLVFMSLYQDADGARAPLPARNVDTGAGLERVAWVLQGARSVYETDELRGVLARVEQVSGRRYDPDGAPEVARAQRAIVDHARAIALLVADGVLPGNEGRGYVLRRVLRRAVYCGHTIGLREPFLERVIDAAIDAAVRWYAAVGEQRAFILRTAAQEESRFQSTLARGLELLEQVIEHEATGHGVRRITGREMFALYDTHGLPPELTREVAAARGYGVDDAGFEAEMAAQRARSSGEAATGSADGERERRHAALGAESEFVGYEATEARSTVIALLDASSERASRLAAGTEGALVLAATAFYPEGGGQVGDRGEIVTPSGRFRVDDTQRHGEAIVHLGAVVEGAIALGEAAESRVDPERRALTASNHTATHLLHAALRQLLGSHVRQAGSYVGPDRLRFDYTHPQAPTAEELRAIHRLVNARIRDDIARETLELPYEQAIERGAIAFFEDRYAPQVRMVEYCGSRGHGHEHSASHPAQHAGACFSRELCGGTHLHSTGQAGSLQIVSDSSIGAGLRRIEAVTGPAAEHYVEERLEIVGDLARRFKVPVEQLPARVAALEEQLAQERARLAASERRASADLATELWSRGAEEIAGVQLVVAHVAVASVEALRSLADRIRQNLGSAVVVLGAEIDGRPQLLVAATDDVVKRGVRADELVRIAAKEIGGSGGGRPQLAQAGGRDASRLDAALDAARAAARERLAGA